MIVSFETVCRACAAIGQRDIPVHQFEKLYHCRFMPHPSDYRIEFDDEKAAVEFLLRFA